MFLFFDFKEQNGSGTFAHFIPSTLSAGGGLGLGYGGYGGFGSGFGFPRTEHIERGIDGHVERYEHTDLFPGARNYFLQKFYKNLLSKNTI